MKFLKGLALSLLSFLLLLSLAVFGLALTLNQTILNPDFATSQVNKLDVSSLAEEFLSEQISPEGEQELIAGAINDTIADLEPWIKEQINAVIYSGYDYLLGRSPSLSAEIPTSPLKESLGENLRTAFYQSLPPELAGASQAEIDAYFDQYYQQFSGQIPAEFEIDEDMIGPEVMTSLEEARQYINTFQAGFKALIALILVLIAGIALIHRQVKGATRQLGITGLVYGIPEYIGVLVAKRFVEEQLGQFAGQATFPTSLQAWLPQITEDFLAPLEMFSLGILIAGIALLAVSFVYKRRETA